MTDSHTPAEPAPAAGDATTPAVEPNPTPTPAPSSVEVTPEIQALIDAAATKASRAANKEAVAAKQRLKDLEAAEEARKDAELGELERAQKAAADAAKRADMAEAAAKANALRAAITAEAVRVGINPDLALKLAADDVTFNESGEPENTAEALDALAAAHPNLVQANPMPQQHPMSPQRGDQTPPVSDAERLASVRAGRDANPVPWWSGGGVLN